MAEGSKPLKRRTMNDYSEVMRSHVPTRNRLAAFMVQPLKAKFGIQEENEKILVILRRHPITNAGWILVVVIMALAPLLIQFLPGLNFLPTNFTFITGVLWYLFIASVAIEGFLSWYYNVYIVTDERVIDVDFMNLIYKNIAAAKIDKIEDVTVEMGGALRSILNFGTLMIQTAAEKTEFEFEDVPRPQEVAKLLNELILEEEREVLEGRVS